MYSANLKGGLGNLMFQIAATISLADGDLDKVLFFRPKKGNIHWNNIDKYEKSIFRKLLFVNDSKLILKTYNEPHFHHTEINCSEHTLLNGYFQSEKYFKKHDSLIREIFEPSCDILEKEPTALHIRRGDYCNLQHVHPLCSMSYYRDAIKEIGKKEHFLIFSDDIEWCKKYFKKQNFHFSDKNTDVEDLYLISMCKNAIISNSTFSWWGAWLNKNEDKKVIAPKMWFSPNVSHNTKDLIPNDWIII
jgi:hypothetical protein